MLRRGLLGSLGTLLAFPGMALARHAYDFGKLAYGTRLTKLPTWAINSTCRHTYEDDCQFKDANGITYVIFDQVVSQIILDVVSYSPVGLPYGLSRHDTNQKILLRLSQHFTNRTPFIFYEYAEGLTLQFDEDDLGTRLEIGFDADGHIRQLRLTSTYL